VNAARRLDVTEGGMTRVQAVVASMAETSSTSASDAGANLTDLIAKAAQEMDHHASATRILRTRGLAQRGRASDSLAAAKRGAVAAVAHKLDVIR
jgi:hypothetical protein